MLCDYLSLWYSTGKNDEGDGEDAPWDKNSEIDAGGVKGVVHIVLADQIYIDSSRMSNKVRRQLRRMATFSNKQYFQNQAMDMPNYDEYRFIYLGNDEGKYIALPHGRREDILKQFDKAGVRYDIEDKRSDGCKINVSFKGNLRESQVPAVETMLKNETGILHAATAPCLERDLTIRGLILCSWQLRFRGRMLWNSTSVDSTVIMKEKKMS